MRNYLGQTLISLRDNIAYEAALGDHGRSGEQFDIWQAVYSPVGTDGYPQLIFDKQTGESSTTLRPPIGRKTRCNACHSAKTMRESVNPIRNLGSGS